MSSDKPVRYGNEHVDTDIHGSFLLARKRAIKPAPIIPVTNTQRVHHNAGMAQVISPPEYNRILLKGDWT